MSISQIIRFYDCYKKNCKKIHYFHILYEDTRYSPNHFDQNKNQFWVLKYKRMSRKPVYFHRVAVYGSILEDLEGYPLSFLSKIKLSLTISKSILRIIPLRNFRKQKNKCSP